MKREMLREMLRNKLPMWFMEKDKYFVAALCNKAYEFEQIKETERAIEIKVTNSITNYTWTKWIPKSLLR